MEIQAERKIKQTEKVISLLCLLSLIATGCSSIPKLEKSDLFLNESIHKKEVELVLGGFILNSAKSQLGIRYKYGGTSPKVGFDCSGLTWYSHKKNGINIPRVSADQFKKGKRIPRKDLMPGDLVFFETYRSGASHVGVYMGNGKFIHSANIGKNVAIQKLSNNYYKKRYLGARRYW